MTQLTWHARDIALLETLSLTLPTMTAGQVTEFFDDDKEQSTNARNRLVQLRLLDVMKVWAYPRTKIERPIFAWQPGDPDPEDGLWDEIAAFLKSRWTKPDKQVTVYVAAPAALRLFGSHRSGMPTETQWSHDIALAECFLHIRRTWPASDLRCVVGEGKKLGKEIKGFKDPDLFVVDSHGQAQLVIESAGAYDATHLKALHRHCSGEAHKKLKSRYPNRKYRLHPSPQGTPYWLV